jgi:hypothetical protein
LDNRKENLQICTHQQNQMKKKQQRNNTSGYRGVYWSSSVRRWCALIRCDRERYHLGSFRTKEEAVVVYNEKAKELFGRFAVLNVIERESVPLGAY